MYNMERYRDIRFKLSDKEWRELKRLKAELGCDTWQDFIKVILRHKHLLKLNRGIPP